MKRILVFALTLVFALSAFTGAFAEGIGETELPDSFYDTSVEISGLAPVFPDGVTDIQKKDVTGYSGDTESKFDFPLYFMNKVNDLPFVNVEDIPAILDIAYNKPIDIGNRYTKDIIGSCMILTRENGASVMLDFVNHTITFDNKCVFTATGGTKTGMDIARVGTKTESDATSFLSMDVGYIRNGSMTEFNLDAYQIPMILQDSIGYIPLQTLSDLFLADIYAMLLYNGENLFVAPFSSIDYLKRNEKETFSGLYYSGKPGEKSEELTQLTYNELCLALDSYYGLAEEHNVTSFDKLFLETGMYEKLLSTDPADTYVALNELTFSFFRDSHSGVTAQSYLLGDRDMSQDIIGYAMMLVEKMLTMTVKYDMARAKFYPEAVPGYEEIDDTAYITFDAFVYDVKRIYRGSEFTNNANDTLELLLYANSQIKRENSPIKNVVLDLSMNGGGMADTAVMTLAWLLGGAMITVKDISNGTESSLIYNFDGNADGEFGDEKDSLGMSTHVYCLISPKSFSCGNFVPAVLKNSNRATLIGERSGGGACVVLPLCTADGNIFSISGNQKISTVQNGTFYSVDQGVEPDYVISNPEHLYDRKYLTEYIHQLS